MTLNKDFQRPIIYLSNWHGLNALLDTGALFPEMAVISCNDFENVPYHILLSATMFQHLRYEIDDENHKFNVTIPDKESCIRNLKIHDKSGKLHVLCNSV
ncbi:MAG: hypothetical protein NC092_09240 [Butyrivibrio sp.]|nr:hypothetical protein [Muribaculum sp.]MCM1552859.1 hypothetical protein [Butyrivibrio sp.]